MKSTSRRSLGIAYTIVKTAFYENSHEKQSKANVCAQPYSKNTKEADIYLE